MRTFSSITIFIFDNEEEEIVWNRERTGIKKICHIFLSPSYIYRMTLLKTKQNLIHVGVR